MVFLSKKDTWMGIIFGALVAAFLWVLYHSVFVQLDILGIIVMITMIFFLGSIWFNTRYIIEGNQLQISYGPIKKTIVIQDIKFIRKTKNPFVAPALSMNRVEINYGKYSTVQVSPKEIEKFVSELQKKNTNIQLKS